MSLLVAHIDSYQYTPMNVLKGLTLETKSGLVITVLEVDEKYSETARPDGTGIVSSSGTVSYLEVNTGDTKIVTLSEFTSLLGIMGLGKALEFGAQRLVAASEATINALLDMLTKKS